MSEVHDVREDDELPHAAGPDLGWCESYAFELYEPEAGLGGFTRIDVRPNQGVMEASLSFLLPDGGFITARHVRPETTSTADLEVEGVRFTMLDPLRRWRLAYDGPAHSIPAARDAGRRDVWAKSRLERLIVDLELEALGPPSRGGPEWFAQPGVLRGEVWVSGDRYELAARGIREKRWGAQSGEALAQCSFRATFADDRALVAERTRSADALEEEGWVLREGRVSPVRGVAVATVTEPGSYLQKSFRLTLRGAAGDEHVVDGEVLQVVPLPGSRGGRSLVECVSTARFTWQGRVGHGFATWVHRLDADGRPVVRVE